MTASPLPLSPETPPLFPPPPLLSLLALPPSATATAHHQPTPARGRTATAPRPAVMPHRHRINTAAAGTIGIRRKAFNHQLKPPPPTLIAYAHPPSSSTPPASQTAQSNAAGDHPAAHSICPTASPAARTLPASRRRHVLAPCPSPHSITRPRVFVAFATPLLPVWQYTV